MPRNADPFRFLFTAALAACIALAQDTPTEKEAAKDVVRKMAYLEKSINVPGWISRFAAPNASRDQVVARAKQLMDTEMLALSDDITKHPEIGFEEHRSAKLLLDSLKRHGFDVTEGVANLKTAFVARYRNNRGAPNLGVILE